MSKSMVVPVESLLHQYRLNALTTPLAAYEMTNVDKEMSDVISRTDIPADQRNKMYFSLLDKYKNVYNVYSASQKIQAPAVKHSEEMEKKRASIKKTLKKRLKEEDEEVFESAEEDEPEKFHIDKEDIDKHLSSTPKMVKNRSLTYDGNATMLDPLKKEEEDEDMEDFVDDDDDSYLSPEQEILAMDDRDPEIDEKIRKKLSGPNSYGTGIRLSEKDLYDEIVDSFLPTKPRRKGLHRTSITKGGDTTRYGKKTEIPMVMSYLLDHENGVQRRPRVNNRLLNAVASTIYDKLPEQQIKTHKGIKKLFPNLLDFVPPSHTILRRKEFEQKENAAAALVASLANPAQPSRSASTSGATTSTFTLKPATLTIPPFQGPSKGSGKVKIMMNKWNDLVH